MSKPYSYERCKICGHFGWAGSHSCPPEWDWWGEKPGDASEAWGRIRARDAEDAATAAAEKYDQDGDYYLVRGGETTIWVQRIGSDEITAWSISAESVPQYHASPAELDE